MGSPRAVEGQLPPNRDPGDKVPATGGCCDPGGPCHRSGGWVLDAAEFMGCSERGEGVPQLRGPGPRAVTRAGAGFRPGI